MRYVTERAWTKSMRRQLTRQTFVRHQINIDDTESSDLLQHFVPAITFIQAELDKNHGVLVHCQAGMSESTSNARSGRLRDIF